ncbi:hypothetical protein IIA79_08760, partial [bacterium]|nr:hypothetical protein [bacterium]
PYFTSYVRDHVLYPSYGADQVLRQGMTVVTTLDPQYQRWAEEILKENIDSARDKKRVSQGALVLIETKTGEVLACVGGYEWLSHTEKGDDKYNRAMLGGRPTGSAFKPFTYATAYEQGFPVSLTIWDGPNVEISKKLGKPWPKNSNGTYRGWVSIPNALQWSRNAASVDLMVNCTGIKPVIETARKMGITADLEEVPSLTLGVASIKPLEMAEAFATFANMGRHVDSILVKKVYNQNGILYETNDSAGAIEKRSNVAFSENTAWIMVQNMRRAVEHGTGVNARVPGVQIAGKTGTNDDYVDAWFIGYSPELVCAVWVGNDDYAVGMKRMFGGDLPAKTFSALMKRIYTRQTKTVGEGDEAAKVVIYEPRYTQTKFEKPAGATFNGFPGAIVGAVLVQDEEGNWVPEEQAEEAGAEEEQQPGDDSEESADPSEHEFYEQWEPPPHVYF